MDFKQFQRLEFRRRVFKLAGAEISITDPASQALVGFIKMKAWRLKEDIRIYADAAQTQELFRIKARNIIDFGATYDVIDSATEQPLFAMKRRGLRSAFVRDHWDILDAAGNACGAVQETSGNLAIVRRWIGLVPVVGEWIELAFAFVEQTYDISYGEGGAAPQTIGSIVHRKNPLVVKMGLDMSMSQGEHDHKVGIAATALLAINDAGKNN